MKTYEPKPGTGWIEGSSYFTDVRRWRVPLDETLFLTATVCASSFTISRVTYGEPHVHSAPLPEDLGRIERDYGVAAWSITGVFPVVTPSTGRCLMALAVDPKN